jgi:hypothetical protein
LYELYELLKQAETDKEKLSRCFTIGAIYYDETLYDSAILYLNRVYEGTNSVGSKKQACRSTMGCTTPAQTWRRKTNCHRTITLASATYSTNSWANATSGRCPSPSPSSSPSTKDQRAHVTILTKTYSDKVVKPAWPNVIFIVKVLGGKLQIKKILNIVVKY